MEHILEVSSGSELESEVLISPEYLLRVESHGELSWICSCTTIKLNIIIDITLHLDIENATYTNTLTD